MYELVMCAKVLQMAIRLADFTAWIFAALRFEGSIPFWCKLD
jgi:hypothetical protein